MSASQWFSFLPLTLIFFLTVVVLLVSVELGSWLSRRTAGLENLEHEAPLGSLVNAVLGLLAFILAFTFSMTFSRFEQRRQLVLDESNTIRTAYLYSTLFPARPSHEIEILLREYVETRLDLTLKNLASRMIRSSQIHASLWAQVNNLMKEKVDGDIRTEFVGEISQLINLHHSRKTVGLSYRIPGVIWASLYFLAVVSMMAIGYQVAAAGSKRLRGMPVLALAIALVITMIVEIDRPSEGQFKVSEQPLREVRETMISPPPSN